MRSAAVSAALLALAIVFAAPALGRRPVIHVRPARVHAGDRVRVSGNADGCGLGNRVILISRAFSHRHDFAGRPAVYATVGARHDFGVRTRIPRHRRPGRYEVRGRCGAGNLGVGARVRVLSS